MRHSTDEDLLPFGEAASHYQNIQKSIFLQIVEDYIKLAHPHFRRKTYLQEHYLESIDALFDPDFRFGTMENYAGEPLSMQELLHEILGTDRDRTFEVQKYVIKEAMNFWREKPMPVLSVIPDTIFIDGLALNIEHDDLPDYDVSDDDNGTIFLNKKPTEPNQKTFLESILYVLNESRHLDLSDDQLSSLADGLFMTLKVNDCFGNAGVPKKEKLWMAYRHTDDEPANTPEE